MIPKNSRENLISNQLNVNNFLLQSMLNWKAIQEACKSISKFLYISHVYYTRNQDLQSCIYNSRCLSSSCSSYLDLYTYRDRGHCIGIFANWGCSSNLSGPAKGQLISECLFDFFKFSKKPTKNLTNFCPRI